MPAPLQLRSWFVWLLVGLAAGCAHGKRPIVRAPAGTLSSIQRIDHLDATAAEPMVVVHPRGVLFVSGYSPPEPKLWKSEDGGATWSSVNVGGAEQGAIGNSDVDLAVARDGTLYFVNMTYDRVAREGTRISIGVSHDVGATWSWTQLSQARFDDRPWVEVAPDGTAHVIWNDGSGVNHAVSEDRGRTWIRRPRVHGQGGSSHLAMGPRGELAVRVTPESASGNKFEPEVDLIAVSVDGGVSWRKHAAPGERRWKFPNDTRWVEPLAWDEAGALYSFWSDADKKRLWLARSADFGATWTRWAVATSADDSYFPYLIARGHGELAATWYSGAGSTLRAHVGRIWIEGQGAPRVWRSAPVAIDAWQTKAPDTRGTAGEYFGLTFLPDGGLAVVTTILNPTKQRFGFTWWRFKPR